MPGTLAMRVLLIEDDSDMAGYIAQSLHDLGHATSVAGDGRIGLELASREPFDVVVVDRMLPGLDGVSVVRTLRGRDMTVPVLFLTTMDGIDDRVAGLEAGGDDYLVKPFAMPELAARINALGRRGRLSVQDTVLRVADLEMDLVKRTVLRKGQRVELQPREFQLLEYLVRHAGQVVTRTMLLENVWDFHFDPQTNIVETHISRLRSKVDREFSDPLIHTVRGTGYVLRDPV
jgi:two-component system OmpR family response regulator